MKKALLAGVAIAALGSAASAADLGSPRGPVEAVVAAPMFNWTGFYFGGHVGAAFSNSNSGLDILGYNFAGEIVPLRSRTSFIGGLAIGYNWQFNQVVVGLEGDLSYLGYRSSNVSAFFGGDTTYRARSDWFGTIRGRLGVAADRALFYVTGGVAFSDLKYSTIDTTVAPPPGGAATINASRSASVGWTVGAGVEYAFTPQWTAKAEYLYASFGGGTASATASTGVPFSFRFNRTDQHIVRLGVNYLFSTGPSAVVARY